MNLEDANDSGKTADIYIINGSWRLSALTGLTYVVRNRHAKRFEGLIGMAKQQTVKRLSRR